MNLELAWLERNLLVGAMLFGIGLVGAICRRNLIVVFLSIELVFQGAALSWVGWSRWHGNVDGQVFVIFLIAVAACEAAIALALFVAIYHHWGRLDVLLGRQLREADLPEADEPAEADSAEALPAPSWPRLPPAGVPPKIDPQTLHQRDRI